MLFRSNKDEIEQTPIVTIVSKLLAYIDTDEDNVASSEEVSPSILYH